MTHFSKSIVPIVLSAFMLVAGPARAENEGQADLDQATQARLGAKTVKDLGRVIELCETALKKGLDEGNTKFAEMMLSAALAQRGEKLTRLAIRAAAAGNPKSAELKKSALEDLEKAVRLDPNKVQSLVFIAQLNRLPGGNLKRASEALDQAIAVEDGEAEHRAQALMLRAAGATDADKKMADLDEAVRVAPNYLAAVHLRGLFHAGRGKAEPALADLNKALELAPKHAPSHEAKALVLASQKKYDEALVALDEALEVLPDSVGLLLKKAAIHSARENFDAALIDLKRIESIQPDNPGMRMARATVYQQTGKLQEAVDDYAAVLAKQPKNWFALRNRADALLNLGKHKEAIADYNKAMKIRSKSAGLLNNLAWVLATSPVDELRDGRRAVKLATEACKLTDYKAPHIISTLAAAYAEVGNFSQAVNWAKKGLEVADEKTKEPLQKELDSYQQKKPWRELLSPKDSNDK